MTRLAMAIVGHEADARDAVAESLLSIWRELPRLRDPLAFDAWTNRIVVHACRQTLRRRGRARVREVPIDSQIDAGASSDVGPADAVASRESLERAFDRLDVDARTILVLHHLEGRSLEEIAAVLEIPRGTAKSRLFTARRALERALEREDR